ncbi:MAG: hypothetical protein KGS61_16300 [Verrucomicrobia bacterium]|nr:hypothetical protein [Verrucomicrobiota bacterium]
MWPSTLMLVPFGIVLCMGMVFAFLLSLQAKRSQDRQLDPATQTDRPGAGGPGAYRPNPFDQPCRWVAVKTANPMAVQAALALNNPTPCGWSDILAKLDEPRLFLSPPVAGWTLVMGQALPDPAGDVDDCFHFVRQLSRKLGLVQFFALNRVLGHHAWVQALDGRIIRAYAWAGETLWNQGRMSAAEIELGLRCCAYGEAVVRPGIGTRDWEAVNTENVMALAARWSIDPTTIDDLSLRGLPGIAGDRPSP